MKKKILAVLLCVSMTAVMFAGCGSSTGGEAASPDDYDFEVPVSDLEVEGDHISISLFAGSLAENTTAGEAIKRMAAYINVNSNGTIDADPFYDTQLGDATSMVQGLQQDTINIGVAGTSYFSGLVPEVDVFQLPYLFSDLEDARAATETDAPAVQAIFEKLETEGNIVGLAFFENGFRELTNNVRPVETPEDMEGIRMRTLSSNVQIEFWESMGALATSIDASELYTALQQGTVNAQDNPLHEIVSRRFYEVQPYITLNDSVYTPLLLGMSKATWDRMSESQQELIREATDWARDQQIELTDEAQAEALQTIKDFGCEVVEEPDRDAFREYGEATWSLFTDEYGTELVDMIQEQLGSDAE